MKLVPHDYSLWMLPSMPSAALRCPSANIIQPPLLNILLVCLSFCDNHTTVLISLHLLPGPLRHDKFHRVRRMSFFRLEGPALRLHAPIAEFAVQEVSRLYAVQSARVIG